MSRKLIPQAEPASTRPVAVLRVGGAIEPDTDHLAVEEPLEIRLAYGPVADRRRRAVSVTMRTPGHDPELALGFLFAEGVVRSRTDVIGLDATGTPNVVRVDLHPDTPVDLGRLERHGFMASGCGVCGKTSLEAVEAVCDPPAPGPPVSAAVIHALPANLRSAQPMFARTGGLHAAAAFDVATGELELVREDVGRHNALDKLVGWMLGRQRLPLTGRGVFVSGRASFELVQKAAAAGAGTLAAVGAPSSLAVELADRFGMLLVGFVRDGRFNVYAGAERLRTGGPGL